MVLLKQTSSCFFPCWWATNSAHPDRIHLLSQLKEGLFALKLHLWFWKVILWELLLSSSMTSSFPTQLQPRSWWIGPASQPAPTTDGPPHSLQNRALKQTELFPQVIQLAARVQKIRTFSQCLKHKIHKYKVFQHISKDQIFNYK